MQKETKRASLKDRFVSEIINGIISGKYPIGERLPSERDLAEQMGISRTVVRSGLAELSGDGVICQEGHRGSVVMDYRTEGKMPIVDAILTSGAPFSQQILEGYLGARILVETETARLAALNRTNDDLYQLFTIIRQGAEIPEEDTKALARQEYCFHKQVAVACGNVFYPIFINSMENTALRLLEEMYCADMCKRDILRLQENLYEAILERNPDKAVRAMQDIFYHRKPE